MKNITTITTPMQKDDFVLVTGITGYLASWIAKYLLDEGYRVRGTVRSLTDVDRINTMRALLPGAEFVEADLRNAAGWENAVAGCQWVFHVASPQAVKSETDRTGGAVQGTEHILTAAFNSGSVRKVVVTSSEAAIAYGHPATKHRFDESDWTVLDGPGVIDYFRSKTLAEKLAWDLARDERRNPHRVALSTVNPGLILGPAMVPWGRFSIELLKNLAEGKMPMLPDMNMAVVDVRDCARMHIAIMQDRSADGKRHLSFGASGKFVDLARAVRDGYSDRGFNPSTRIAPQCVLWVMKFFSGDVASIYNHTGHEKVYVQQSPNVYRYRHTDLRQIVRDSMDQMLKNGWLTIKTR